MMKLVLAFKVILLLISSVTCNAKSHDESTFYQSVLKSFEENGPIDCVLWISEEGRPGDFPEPSEMTKGEPEVPVIKYSKESQDLKSMSQKCQNHVFVLKDVKSAYSINENNFRVSKTIFTFEKRGVVKGVS